MCFASRVANTAFVYHGFTQRAANTEVFVMVFASRTANTMLANTVVFTMRSASRLVNIIVFRICLHRGLQQLFLEWRLHQGLQMTTWRLRGGASVLQHLLSIMPYQGANIIGSYGLGSFYDKVVDNRLQEGEDKNELNTVVQQLIEAV